MNGLKIRIWIAAALCLAACALSGCSFKRSPEATARQFVEAMRGGDEAAARALMTRAAREKMASPLDFGHGRPPSYRLGQPSIYEESARVPVTFRDNGKSNTMTVKMKQDEGEWRVYGLGFVLTPGAPEVTYDMEHPDAIYGELFRGLGEGMGAMFKGMGEGLGAMMKGLGEGARSANEASHAR